MTDKIAGKNKDISSLPIKIKIFSKNVPDLNLVDLPGITKNPVDGQPEDIEEKNLEIIKTYIKNPDSIILAISRANEDISNSESLKLARIVDPDGDRTIGVITCIDLVEEETDALNYLDNKIYNLKLGYFGVILRSNHPKKPRTIEE